MFRLRTYSKGLFKQPETMIDCCSLEEAEEAIIAHIKKNTNMIVNEGKTIADIKGNTYTLSDKLIITYDQKYTIYDGKVYEKHIEVETCHESKKVFGGYECVHAFVSKKKRFFRKSPIVPVTSTLSKNASREEIIEHAKKLFCTAFKAENKVKDPMEYEPMVYETIFKQYDEVCNTIADWMNMFMSSWHTKESIHELYLRARVHRNYLANQILYYDKNAAIQYDNTTILRAQSIADKGYEGMTGKELLEIKAYEGTLIKTHEREKDNVKHTFLALPDILYDSDNDQQETIAEQETIAKNDNNRWILELATSAFARGKLAEIEANKLSGSHKRIGFYKKAMSYYTDACNILEKLASSNEKANDIYVKVRVHLMNTAREIYNIEDEVIREKFAELIKECAQIVKNGYDDISGNQCKNIEKYENEVFPVKKIYIQGSHAETQIFSRKRLDGTLKTITTYHDNGIFSITPSEKVNDEIKDDEIADNLTDATHHQSKL